MILAEASSSYEDIKLEDNVESKDDTIDTDEMSSDAIIAIETTSMHVDDDDDPRNITSLSFDQVLKALFIKCKL
jgi:hypothetical protein